MIDTIALDGMTNTELNFLVLRGSQRPVLPQTVDRFLTIAGRNGMYDFGADIGGKQFNFLCAFNTSGPAQLAYFASELAAFLVDERGKPRTIDLVILTQPDRKYSVRYAGIMPLDRIVGYGEFTLPLIAVDPRAHSIAVTTDNPILDSDFGLDSLLRLDDIFGFTLNGPGNYEINNWGNLICDPEIMITGSFSNIGITTNGKTFSFNTPIDNQTIVINGERMTVKLDGVNAMMSMSGDFVELAPGINDVTVSGTDLDCSISFIYRAKFI